MVSRKVPTSVLRLVTTSRYPLLAGSLPRGCKSVRMFWLPLIFTSVIVNGCPSRLNEQRGADRFPLTAHEPGIGWVNSDKG